MSNVKAAAELAAVLAQEIAAGFGADGRRNPSPEMIAADVIALQRLGAAVARMAVQQCNGIPRWRDGRMIPTWDESDDARAERVKERARVKGGEIAAQYGASVRVGGDPRGFTFALILKSGRSNSFAGGVWGVI